MDEKKYFIKISTDNPKVIENIWLHNQEIFGKLDSLEFSFDDDSSKKVNEDWTEPEEETEDEDESVDDTE